MFVSMLQRMALETDKLASFTGTMRGMELAQAVVPSWERD
jgi:hypothetical protein